jgi:hypothetical protein
MRTFFRFAVLLVTLTGLAAFAAGAKYQNIVITRFETAKGVSFPASYQKALTDSLVEQFIESKMFAKVVGPGEAGAYPPGTTLKLTGVVTHFDPGNQTGRHVAGVFGVGKASVTAHVKLLDAASGQVKLETDVKGTYKGSLSFTGDTAWGGKPINGARALAKEIVKVAKGKL